MENGLVQVYCGKGKGKTTAAIGLGIRALGNGYKVIMIQFLKHDTTSECKMIKALEPEFKIFHFEKKRGFTWQLNDEEKQEIKSETSNALKFASKVMDTGQCDVLILDEILNSLELGFVSEEEVITLIENKSDDVELVLTGRTLPESIANKADYISRIESIKHPMDKGIDARKGIEY
ncbi:MAG: cob(I)yrinic acid a,c-diamide adenosyltransferase [Cellulosilyticum sp.]|nr:cob(I)yrinic acid a,c-diamide adenosyltransferase [Cellulosilyticum sp.]